MYEVFAFVDGQFKSPLETFISDGTSNISEWAAGPLTVAITLYVVLYGYLVLRGSVQDPVLGFAYKAIKLAIIVMLVKNASEYQIYVTNIFFDVLPREISQALNTGAVPSASTFDSLLDKGQASATAIWSRASWPVDLVTSVGGMMVIGASFLVAAIGYIVSLYARLALAIVLAIGPIFVALAMFQSTRRFTEAWIGQLANFVILQVLVVAVGYRGSNPDSPQNTYGRSATARINIASISLINPNVVSVRYMRTITRGEETRTSHWIATLTFAYVNAPMSSTDRLVNPLGFAVSEYRADPETVN